MLNYLILLVPPLRGGNEYEESINIGTIKAFDKKISAKSFINNIFSCTLCNIHILLMLLYILVIGSTVKSLTP